MWKNIDELNRHLVGCCRCPRLVEFRQRIALYKVKRFRDQDYWGKPVPGFGDINAELLIVGLAPGAHGSNRTGRVFTGDQSGSFLYEVLYETGFSNKPCSLCPGDGLELRNCYVTAVVRCVPPENRPKREEIENCMRFFDAEFALLKNVRVVVTLGMIAFDTFVRYLREKGMWNSETVPRFKHGERFFFGDRGVLITSYHPSRQNTQTGRLTKGMFLEVFLAAKDILS
ncbi:hypothetical protein HRbin37_01161 [bacterium HR37]|nr:hypothetical protein HRbin37_01161 [bacterium HR37]